MPAFILLLLIAATATADAGEPPAGFTRLFNDKDLEEAAIAGDGEGVFLTSDGDYADFELVLEWMVPAAGGDGGIHVRGRPQLPLRDPVAKADRPSGEWNTTRMRMQGDRVTVELNDQLIVDDQPPAADVAKGQQQPARGPFQIRTRGGPIHVRNVFIRELGTFDGSGPGWRDLGENDFENANCEADTWTWKNGTARCTGKPVGVIRTKRTLTNLELSAEWRHLSKGGNSGFFLWAPPKVFEALRPGQLPQGGIEVQVLDHGYAEQYEKSSGKKADWFTTDGDVFPVGSSTMKPFPPVSPDKKRSFPTARHSRGTPEWNHYYVRAINGEVRLWVNGHEVSGGTGCSPATGHLCLESEGAPVEFRHLRIRELPGPLPAPPTSP